MSGVKRVVASNGDYITWLDFPVVRLSRGPGVSKFGRPNAQYFSDSSNELRYGSIFLQALQKSSPSSVVHACYVFPFLALLAKYQLDPSQ